MMHAQLVAEGAGLNPRFKAKLSVVVIKDE